MICWKKQKSPDHNGKWSGHGTNINFNINVIVIKVICRLVRALQQRHDQKDRSCSSMPRPIPEPWR